MNKRRVVITGMGVMTPCGNTVSEFWTSLAAGRSGIGPITGFDTTGYDCKFAGEVRHFTPAQFYKNPKDAKRSDRYTQLAFAATHEAIHHAKLLPGSFDPDRAGTIIGSGIGGLKSLEDQHTSLITKGPGRVSPFMIPMMISNMASGLIAMEYNLRGPNYAVVSACATSAQSIGEAWRLIRDEEAEVIVAGGSEAACSPLGISGFGNMKALSMRNEAPEKASRPFDKDRDGFVLSEGAAIVVLEELSHAQKRGAPIYAELTGYGTTCDAYHMTSPDPQGSGAARAMRIALKHAHLEPGQIDYINAHATSTTLGDICETAAIKSVFGAEAKKMAISATKSMTGHLLGAAGAVELIACVKAMENSLVPPTINLDQPDPECDLDYVPHTARPMRVDRVLSNSFGFGGHNACLVAEKFV
jgi:3-oxoacyl-[acyl-carrier-protein] synthase II